MEILVLVISDNGTKNITELDVGKDVTIQENHHGVDISWGDQHEGFTGKMVQVYTRHATIVVWRR
ncbi:hypothetical protein MED16_gp71 [Pantoea phage vB_PagS_MED16]|nr:hypothetical protein MED16_gp71 [Pantoea phage vB_PagS_MED16]